MNEEEYDSIYDTEYDLMTKTATRRKENKMLKELDWNKPLFWRYSNGSKMDYDTPPKKIGVVDTNKDLNIIQYGNNHYAIVDKFGRPLLFSPPIFQENGPSLQNEDDVINLDQWLSVVSYDKGQTFAIDAIGEDQVLNSMDKWMKFSYEEFTHVFFLNIHSGDVVRHKEDKLVNWDRPVIFKEKPDWPGTLKIKGITSDGHVIVELSSGDRLRVYNVDGTPTYPTDYTLINREGYLHVYNFEGKWELNEKFYDDDELSSFICNKKDAAFYHEDWQQSKGNGTSFLIKL